MTGAIDAGMLDMGKKARLAADFLALAPRAIKDHALMLAAQNIRAHASEILSANELDQAAAHKRGLSGAMVERLILNPARLESIAHGLEVVAQLPDPVGVVTDHWVQPNGLDFSRVRVPLGVVGIIFESRPNVTIDAGALCLKSGNAAILRGGSDALRTSTALAAQLAAGIIEAGLPDHCVQLVASEDRAAVGAMLSGLNGAIDVIVPRGGKGLVARVQEDARVPVLAHLDGNCHVYIHRAADPKKAMAITLNAKLRRTGVCGSAETVLFDTGFDARPIIRALLDQGCAVRGDNAIQALDSRVQPVADADWDTEFLDAIIAAGVVSSLDDAIDHIGRHGSHHTDAIITEDQSAADQFLRRVDSAIVLHNASTQFADGAEFGFGAEIGIATGRLHARGPVGLEQLTTIKYCVRGQAHIRP